MLPTVWGLPDLLTAHVGYRDGYGYTTGMVGC